MPTPGRRVIYIKNPKSGSNFRTINGSGGGGGRKWTPNPNGSTLFDIIGIQPWQPLPNGPGINYSQGTWTGTGGAVYNTPASNWFVHHPSAPGFGNYNGPGVGPYQAPVFEQFQPAQTIWGSLYLIASGIDPNTGDILPPYGTPGTLRDEISLTLANQAIDAGWGGISGGKNPAYFGDTGKLSSAYWGKAPNRNKKRPWWAK
jgi:hypothetical protein